MNAETDNVLVSTVYAVTLQWGRVLMNAETILEFSGSHRTLALQWGRVLMNAETRPVTPSW